MQVIKKRNLSPFVVLLLAGLLSICGCTPPGPRALLKGEKLIQQGQYAQAIEQLQVAVRLLPRNPQAWNHLGLAYHGHNEPAQAAKSYRQALTVDHKLSAAQFNLGCLYLEHNDLTNAIEYLTSYTMLETRSVPGLLKLGTAHLRARNLDKAEQQFKKVLDVQPRNPEALNDLGMVQFLRRRTTEAMNYFQQALVQSTNYPPALLNLAIAQQSFNNRSTALQRYRQYLASTPRPENWAAVSALAAQLDAELNPPPVVAAVVPPAPVSPPKTNPPVVTPPVIHPPATTVVARVLSTNTPTIISALPRTNPPAKTNVTKPPLVPVIVSHPANPASLVAKTTAPPAVVRVVTPTNKPAELEVTHVSEDLVIKPPQDIASGPARSVANPTQEPATVSPATFSREETTTVKPEKRSFISRLNPFGNHSKPVPAPTVVALNADQGKESTNTEAPVRPAVPSFPKYTYLNPARPAAGQHAAAEPLFAGAVRAQQSGKLAEAIAGYQKTLQVDPGYFEAYYNQGLAGFDQGNAPMALRAFEHALALKPDHIDARYNFALALKQGNYIQDCASELQKIIQARPSETRAHLLLANIYAQKLNQTALAREHYMQVLQADPFHPKAAEIRYWLAGHP